MHSVRARLEALVLTLGLLASGCDDEPNPNEMAERMQRELGVPVFIWAYSDDACVRQQLVAFYDEYKDLGSRDRDAYAQRLRSRYDAIIFQASEDAGRIEGTVIEVRFDRSRCLPDPTVGPSSCHGLGGSSRTYNEVTHTTSLRPGTRLEKGREIVLLATRATDHVVRRSYTTQDAGLYRRLTSENAAAALETAIGLGRARLVRQSAASGEIVCGPMARLNEAF